MTLTVSHKFGMGVGFQTPCQEVRRDPQKNYEIVTMKTPGKIPFNQPINQCNGKGSGQEFCCHCSIATTRQERAQSPDTQCMIHFQSLTWNLKMMVSPFPGG